MSIKDLFSKELTEFHMKSKNKRDVIDELIELLKINGKIEDVEAFRKAVLQREDQFSTGIGMGIAIPHGRGAMVNKTSIVFGRSLEGIDFNSIDGEPVKMVFLLAVTEGESETHLKAVADIARKLMHKDIRDKLLKARDYEDFESIW